MLSRTITIDYIPDCSKLSTVHTTLIKNARKPLLYTDRELFKTDSFSKGPKKREIIDQKIVLPSFWLSPTLVLDRILQFN